MSEASYLFARDKKFAIINKIGSIKLEIENRRGVLEKKLNSDTIKNKVESKVSKITSKVNSIEDSIESKTDYYRNEMTRYYHKTDAEKDLLRQKYEAQEKALTAKFEEYNSYCLKQIELIEKNDTKKKDSLEQNVEILTKELEVDEEADSILSKLKISLEQAEKQKEEIDLLMLKEEMARERRIASNEQETIIKAKREKDDLEYKLEQEIKQAKLDRIEQNRKDTERQDKERRNQLSNTPILTNEEEEEQRIKQEEQKKEDAKLRAKKVKEFFSVNNRKIKYDNLTDKQDDKYQKLQSFEEKGKFLDALPLPET
jgi:hypothetical protein